MSDRYTDLSRTEIVHRLDMLAELEERFVELFREAETDSLTGLPNMRGLKRRTEGREGYFVLCDLNGFKAAQDAHPEGHAFGDRVLREFADFLRSIVRQHVDEGRPADLIGFRRGGDEFALFVGGPLELARIGARRIKGMVRLWQSAYGPVTAACGAGDTLEAADAAMYLHKRHGKDLIELPHPDSVAGLNAREHAQALGQALEEHRRTAR